jgi:hypothetical protein
VDVEHDPVDSPLGFVQFFEEKVGHKNSAQDEECVNTWKSIQNSLKSVGFHKLKKKVFVDFSRLNAFMLNITL